jgi:hypothetical protein
MVNVVPLAGPEAGDTPAIPAHPLASIVSVPFAADSAAVTVAVWPLDVKPIVDGETVSAPGVAVGTGVGAGVAGVYGGIDGPAAPPPPHPAESKRTKAPKI